ncbi:MAG: class I SAM-dependent RNA methyltransferase [Treponema sp.]|jgi:putative N6-adenine-specific DNA methylase|nr:class I SAM-dependent RNA methyltransferase [Treponema sp.]
MEKINTAVALCAVGAEKVVSNELRKLNFKVDESLYGRVRFKADTAGLYRALIGLRAADRVLLEVSNFKAENFDALFEGTSAAPWEQIVPKGMGLKIAKVRSSRSRLKAETSIQAMVHKAAAQRLCGKYKVSRLPDSGSGVYSEAEARVYIEKDIVSLLVDLSGEPLFKRGYRSEGGIAPLRETTAASILLLSGWKRKFPLYDPFCGSGTILIEAAMYAWDMAPGLGRNFAVEKLALADAKIEQSVRDEFRSKIDFSRLIRIAGSDEDPRSVSIAASNAERLRDIAEGRDPQKGIRSGTKVMELKTLPLKEAKSPFSGTGQSDQGLLITNPPYGKRLGDQAQAEKIYREMGSLGINSLGRRFPGWKLGVITDSEGFESFFGKKAESCREISHGNTPSYFYQYDL